jgi:hypothetical protein
LSRFGFWVDRLDLLEAQLRQQEVRFSHGRATFQDARNVWRQKKIRISQDPTTGITLPGAVADVGGIVLNIVGHPVTAPGKVITFDGKTLVIPEQNAGVPSVPVGTPNQSITVNINGALEQAHYLPPN